ncbi:hypothetical protein EBT25_18625 [bacterium]|nr:hypothetical protein [bacterium]
MTYLELVNDILIRLREAEVETVAQTDYSKLIGKFVNDAKRQVEDAYSWNVLSTTLTISTVANTHSYSMTGAGQKFRVVDAINDTQDLTLRNIPFANMNRFLNFGTTQTAAPTYYAFNGVDSSDDTKVDVYPVPDKAYSLVFDLIIPQATLSSDATDLLVPSELVIQNAYARALVERGEDGGLNSSEAYQLYRSMLADYIALESTRYPEEMTFEAN